MDEVNDQHCKVEKFDIKVKTKSKDGLILQLHHTVRGSNGENRRIRFSSAVFDDAHEKLACADNAGNIFILDFYELKFWKLICKGPCTALHFVPNKQDVLVIASAKHYDINFMDVETGCCSLTLKGHTAPIKHISFSNTKINNLLTASVQEAVLWELKNYTKYFTLNTYPGAQIQQIMFTPAGDYLVACFQNDTVQIWKHENMKSIKQIIPSELKHIKNLAFTMNGRAMAMAGLCSKLILFSMDTWKALKSIDLTTYNISGAQQIGFIPQMFDGGANKILAILSSDCILHLMNLETLQVIHTIRPDSSGIRKFVVSPTGKYFLCILQLGEVNIYNTSNAIDMMQNSAPSPVKNRPACTSTYNEHTPCPTKSPTIAEVEQKMRVCMESARLRRILMQYGEYPDKFRSIIWRSLLATPRNKPAYSSLVEKGIHSAYENIEKQFTIHSSITLKSLKRLLSCLAHWCPLFGVTKFLPGFVFPFVKVLQKDPLLLFECVATVLLNQCQLWFEYAPFPPISILAIIENILGEHDQQLLDHYCTLGVTSQTYALKILETAFSEVLTCSEWLILWDHIFSNEPAFILMAVVSYNIVQKNAIRKLKNHEQLENFFHMQNPIDKKIFLKKAYVMLKDTPEDIHPRRFLNKFTALEKGNCYQQFNGYPKATICLKLAKKERKKLNNKKPSLKELTTRSQEKEINQRILTSDLDCRPVFSDDENIEVCRKTSKKLRKRDRINHRHTKPEEGDHKNTIKDDLIESIMYPATIQVRKNKGHYSKKPGSRGRDTVDRNNFKSKPKKFSDKNNVLEKEVEKIIKSCSNSESSDS
ncbi:TBC1 domain family member 31 [Epargyreus clarus]|uniref:TBC1 domain family member 31 n=1 Tax=Epargyreus clarus TaxID=520877 RepID=UPI003C2DF5C9